MTFEEAKALQIGDTVYYNNAKWKVAATKEIRSHATNEIILQIKCKRGNDTIWAFNELLEKIGSTNADHIRSMTDEELAKYIIDLKQTWELNNDGTITSAFYTSDNEWFLTRDPAVKHETKWLKSEYKGE
jgi:hypothetical protein